MSVVLFAGPTLPAAAAAAALPGAIVLPPARQGDVWRAVRARRPRAIALIDGVFLHEPAVWHRELLWAMAQGVHVWGAASMGALRAAELAAFGMRGVGRVFEAYRDGAWPGFDGAFEDDDEVAVTHAPAELGARPLSDAMVDLRATLLAAEADGVLGRAARDGLAAVLKALPFPERSFARLASLASEHADFAVWLSGNRVSQKQEDARALLAALGEFLAGDPPPFVPGFTFRHVAAWAEFLAEADAPDAAEARALAALRRDPPAWRATARAALGRLLALERAPAGDARAALDDFRIARGLARRADVEAWRAAQAATPARLAGLMEEEAALDAALAAAPPPGLERAMLAELRLSGRYAALLAAAGRATDSGDILSLADNFR